MHQAIRTRASRRAAASTLGFRRVSQVRVIVGGGCAVAEVTGVTHRHPRNFRVSLASAGQLAGAGVPLRLEHRGATVTDGGR